MATSQARRGNLQGPRRPSSTMMDAWASCLPQNFRTQPFFGGGTSGIERLGPVGAGFPTSTADDGGGKATRGSDGRCSTDVSTLPKNDTTNVPSAAPSETRVHMVERFFWALSKLLFPAAMIGFPLISRLPEYVENPLERGSPNSITLQYGD